MSWTRVLGGVALLAMVAASAFALFGVPADVNQGDAQRIMYVHVPSAWLAYLSFGVTALSGIASPREPMMASDKGSVRASMRCTTPSARMNTISSGI